MPRNTSLLLVALLALAAAGSALAKAKAKTPSQLVRYVSVVRFNQGDRVKYVFDSYNVVKRACVKTTNITRVYSGIDLGLNPDQGPMRNYGVIFVMDFKKPEDAYPYLTCMKDSPLMPEDARTVGHLENAAGFVPYDDSNMPNGKEVVEFYLYSYANTTNFTVANAAIAAGVESSIKDTKKFMLPKLEEHQACHNELTAPLYFPPTGYYGFAGFKSTGNFQKYIKAVNANKMLSDAKTKYVTGGGRMQFKPYVIKK